MEQFAPMRRRILTVVAILALSITGAAGATQPPHAAPAAASTPGRPAAVLPSDVAPPQVAGPAGAAGAIEALGALGSGDRATSGGGGAALRPAAIDGHPESVFLPGFIISDYNFYNSQSMSTSDVQAFLEARRCQPRDDSPCLADYREDTESQPGHGNGHCAAYSGAPSERASRIISRVAAACGVSPEVLVVLLQKEQSLLTRPSASGYLRATGYGCPDTADCNAEYFGFFNQVYRAAWQFRQYTQEPVRPYRIGSIDVRYHPNPACGSSVVRIENQATANLYNYTPYQPNDAALAGGTRAGDACSAYGNLNFWTLYNRWFGPSTSERYPPIFDRCLNLAGGQPCREKDLIPVR